MMGNLKSLYFKNPFNNLSIITRAATWPKIIAFVYAAKSLRPKAETSCSDKPAHPAARYLNLFLYCRRLLYKSFRLCQHLILGWSTYITSVNIDKGPFAAGSAVGLAADFDLCIRCHLAQLGHNRLHSGVIALITNLYFVSHGATLLLSLFTAAV